jgi:anthranilate phosphoribosyltransferase
MTTQFSKSPAPSKGSTDSTPSPTSVVITEPSVRVANFVRKVGKGRTLLKSMDRAEALDAFTLLFAGAFAESQAGAFLQALRIKELGRDELDGLMDAFLERQPAAVPKLPSGGYTLNLASDTPRKGGYASLLASAMLAAEGVPIGVVRSEPVLSKNNASWDGTWDLIRAQSGGLLHNADCEDGCETPHAPAALCVVESNDLVPELRSLRKIRGELGFRSCLHTAEKLLNPWVDKTIVLGISHKHYADRMADHFARRGMTAKILLGNHGTPDLVLHKETEVCEVLPGGEIRTVQFHPSQLGLEPDPSLYTLGSFAAWAEELAKPDHGALGPVLAYHLAFYRYVAGVEAPAPAGVVSGARTLTPQLMASPVTAGADGVA